VIIYLVTEPKHDLSGYGDALIDAEHPHVLVSFQKYAGQNIEPIKGLSRTRPITHPCARFCQKATELGLPEQSCNRGTCYYEDLGIIQDR